MKIYVPKDKCLLNVLAEMGDQSKDAWFFLHNNLVENLKSSNGISFKEGEKKGTLVFTFESTKNDKPKMIIDICGLNADWKPILSISDSNIAFKTMPADFEEIYFLRLAE